MWGGGVDGEELFFGTPGGAALFDNSAAAVYKIALP